MNGIEVRSFNQKGISAVAEFLQSLRDRRNQQNQVELLDDRSLTHAAHKGVFVESRGFASRREAADYFHQKFEQMPSVEVRNNAGLWTWLSLFYFDQICPEIDGERKVRNDYTYIFMPDQSMYFYRHLLFVAWYAKHLSPTHNRLFLDTTVHHLDKFTQDTRLAAARDLFEEGMRPLALNFANGVEPGGGFLRGATAQEETLCRSSALYATLFGDPMYDYHRENDPYAPAIGRTDSARMLRQRIHRVLAIARAYDYQSLVLGAWGCGVFANDPRQTALDFRQALEVDFAGAFARVVFAIADWSDERRFLRPFCEVFSNDQHGV